MFKIRRLLLAILLALGPLFGPVSVFGHEPGDAQALLLELIQPNTVLGPAWLAKANAALGNPEPSQALAILRGIAVNFRSVFESKLKNEQVLFYKELFAGMIVSDRTGRNQWPTDMALETVGRTILKLYLAEYNLHLALNDNAGSLYLSSGALKGMDFACDKNAAKLPPALRKAFSAQCAEYKQLSLEQGQEARNGFSGLAVRAEASLRVMMEKRDQMVKRQRAISARIGRLAQDADLIVDGDYSTTLLELRSCQATFFDGSESLSPVLRHTIKFKDFLEDYRSNRVQTLLPVRAPIERYLFEMSNRVKNRDGSPLTVDQAAIHVGNFLMGSKHEMIERTVQLRQFLISEYLALETDARTGYQVSERSVKWMAHFPLVAGATLAGVPELNKHVIPELLKASTYFSDRNEVFADRMFYTGLMSLATIFIPGPNVAVGLGMSFKAGTLVYGALLAAQSAILFEHMRDFSIDYYVTSREEILAGGSPFARMKSEEIMRGLFDGGLNSAFLITGEALAGFQLGKNVLSEQFSNFITWSRLKRSQLLKNQARTNYVDPIGKWFQSGPLPVLQDAKATLDKISKLNLKTAEGRDAMTAIADAFSARNADLSGIEAGLAAVMPKGTQGFLRARHLVQALEENSAYQQLLIETTRKIPNELDRRIFLEIIIERAMLFAEVGGNFFMTKYGYVLAARKHVTELYEAYAVAGKFKGDLYSYISVTPNPLAKHAAELRKHLVLLPQLLEGKLAAASAKVKHPQLAAITDQLIGTMTKAVLFKMENKINKTLRPLERILGLRDARNVHYPFVKEFADQVKTNALEVADKLMHDPEVRKIFFAGAIDIDSPGYSMRQAEFYIEKVVVMTEIIDEQIIRMSTQGGVTYSNIRESVLHALHKVNEGPADFALKMVEMTGIVSRLLIANKMTDEQRVMFQAQASKLQPLNCAIK